MADTKNSSIIRMLFILTFMQLICSFIYSVCITSLDKNPAGETGLCCSGSGESDQILWGKDSPSQNELFSFISGKKAFFLVLEWKKGFKYTMLGKKVRLRDKSQRVY